VPDLPLAFRQPRLAKFFGVCQCSLCQEDTRDPGIRERADKVIRIIRETSDDETTFAEIKAAEATSNSQLAAIVKRRTEMARELDATYGAEREMARVDLFFGWEALRAPLRAIAERKAKEKEYLAWGRNEVRALVALGVDFATESVMGLATPARFTSTPAALEGSLPIRIPPAFRPVEAARSRVLRASLGGLPTCRRRRPKRPRPGPPSPMRGSGPPFGSSTFTSEAGARCLPSAGGTSSPLRA
jgi:hypothetical protein